MTCYSTKGQKKFTRNIALPRWSTIRISVLTSILMMAVNAAETFKKFRKIYHDYLTRFEDGRRITAEI